ncbi:hypothetical protein [Lampropedia aestuarii]|uniref:hypothetical protein n=1 Tax=Lampropedia aestuarii TaxID=2562762 RepID=UPI00246884EF|nr:hypothetical protein [Lampropedia aestuarii]MDH5857802.1 hypothetical protein [Lampropedia aestuarii]
MTAPDGQALYLAEEFEALLPEHVATIYPNGAPCQTLHLDHFDGGHSVRAWADRLFIAQGDVLWYSEAMRPNLTSKRHNFVRFVGAIRFIEPVEGGLFVGDDRGVWFLSGAEPSAWSQSFVSSVRAISGSSTQLPGSHLAGGEAATNSAIWLSENGYMNGLPGGTVVPLQPGRIQIDHTVAGRTVLALRNGVRQAITLTATVPRSANGVAIDTTSKNKSQSHLNRSLV